MKSIFKLIIILFISSTIQSQTSKWNVNSDTTIKIEDSIILGIYNLLKPADSLFAQGSWYKIDCQTTDTFFITLKNIGDTLLRTQFCDTIVDLKIDANIRSIVSSSENELLLEIINSEIPFRTIVVSAKIGISSNIYYDAYALAFGDTNSWPEIINKYGIDSTNSFLNHFNNKLKNQNRGSLFSAGKKKSESASISSISSILGLDVTTYVDGLSKFLVSRVKQELAIAYFNKFSTAIRDTNTRDIQVLFKQTYNVLDLIGDRIYDFKPYIHAIRDGMEEDFKRLPEGFNALVLDDSSQLSQSINTLRNMRFLANNLLALNISIKNNDHVGIALANLEPCLFLEKPYTDTFVIGAVQTLQLFSVSLKDSVTINDSIYWVSYNKINELIQNDDFLNCFMGLVTQKAKDKNIRFGTKSSLYSILNDTLGPKKVKEFKGLLSSFKSTFGKIQDIHQKFRTAANMDEQGSMIAGYFDATHSLISTCNEFNTLFRLNQKEKINNLVTISSDINGIVKNISVKKYSIAATHLAHLYSEFKVNKTNWRWYNIVNFIIENSMFLSQMAEAETSNQVDSLLQIYAAPIGSWRDKRESKWNMAIDSYVGAGGFFSGKDLKDKRYNLSSPVGISFSKSIGKYSATVLLSIIDIGPITAFRFKNDTGEIIKISLNEILSPGIHSSFHFGKKFPLTFNIGYQQYPLLMKVDAESNEFNLKRAPGLAFSLNMNIPLFTLSNVRPTSKQSLNVQNEKKRELNLIKSAKQNIDKTQIDAQNKVNRKQKKVNQANEQLSRAQQDKETILQSVIKK